MNSLQRNHIYIVCRYLTFTATWAQSLGCQRLGRSALLVNRRALLVRLCNIGRYFGIKSAVVRTASPNIKTSSTHGHCSRRQKQHNVHRQLVHRGFPLRCTGSWSRFLWRIPQLQLCWCSSRWHYHSRCSGLYTGLSLEVRIANTEKMWRHNHCTAKSSYTALSREVRTANTRCDVTITLQQNIHTLEVHTANTAKNIWRHNHYRANWTITGIITTAATAGSITIDLTSLWCSGASVFKDKYKFVYAAYTFNVYIYIYI